MIEERMIEEREMPLFEKPGGVNQARPLTPSLTWVLLCNHSEIFS
jgi:hypothetical protein